MILKFENGEQTNAPTDQDIQTGVESLTSAGNSFVILEDTPQTYIQAAKSDDGWFDIEYQQGSLDEHFAGTRPVDDQLLIDILTSYLNDTQAWLELVDWKKITIP